ncbi:helix-turn-helix domain-containing protein [Saccharopolyspora sp. NPDC002686]|uniref:helix-turn-helix domain-containing protein n=1 Tax=Saccharopolyspora sp. NPDC002686 TaxID=3154541 RepID=UPI00331D0509
MNEASPSPWMTVKEVATYSRHDRKFVLTALRRSQLRGFQACVNGTWRIHRDDVDTWIRGEKPSRRRGLTAA